MSGEAVHVYVYYRTVGEPAEARRRVGRLFAAVEADTGIAGRLLARCDDPSTWMEIYEPVADRQAFLACLERCVDAAHAAAHAQDGRRHLECFATPAAALPVAS